MRSAIRLAGVRTAGTYGPGGGGRHPYRAEYAWSHAEGNEPIGPAASFAMFTDPSGALIGLLRQSSPIAG